MKLFKKIITVLLLIPFVLIGGLWVIVLIQLIINDEIWWRDSFFTSDCTEDTTPCLTQYPPGFAKGTTPLQKIHISTYQNYN